ncbi:MAG: hypothetical protein FWC70_01030 [Defluviitaleaceae bacterium]|nr:hypothetical protein [Defluviitaleaceae bacterium]
MIKKNMLTAFGIILSFVIAVGGWAITSRLIDTESYRLLSGTKSFVAQIPIIESANEGTVRLGLTDNEIVSVLRNWNLTDYRRPHEPAPGQIDMEQAIASGRAWLDFLYDHNILPAEMLEFSNVGAILSQNVPAGEEFLPLRYSYWNLTFRNEHLDILMTVNAVTGQVWQTEIAANINPWYAVVMLPPDLSVSRNELLNMLSAFMSDSGIRTTQSPVTIWDNRELLSELAGARRTNPQDEAIVYQSFADNNAAAIVDASGAFALAPDGEMSFFRLNIYLTI